MRRVYTDNVQVLSVSCEDPVRAALDLRQQSRKGVSPVDALVIDTEGADDRVVLRYLQLAGGPPPVLVYEVAHLRKPRRTALAARLAAHGIIYYHWNSICS